MWEGQIWWSWDRFECVLISTRLSVWSWAKGKHSLFLEKVMEQEWSWWALKVMEDNLCLPFWVKKKNHSRQFWEDVKTRLGLKLKQLHRRQLERSSQTVWCLYTSHSHTAASKKLNKPVKGVFTFFQNTLSGCWDMCIKWSLCATLVYKFSSTITSHTATE